MPHLIAKRQRRSQLHSKRAVKYGKSADASMRAELASRFGPATLRICAHFPQTSRRDLDSNLRALGE
jgi:hypothetical protein